MAARIALLLALSVALALADEAADKATFQKVCGSCHAPSIVSDLKTQADWIETVANMTANGAKGTDEQFAAVMRYLAHNFTSVNVNTAPPEEIAPALDIPYTLAEAVAAYRTQHGPFASLTDLGKVPGLDVAKIAARKDKIAFR